MVTARAENTPYRTRFTVDGHEAYADVGTEKGGGGAGFGPHALLEASVACCISIWLRMFADKRAIPLAAVTAEVRLNRSTPGQTVFEYAVDLEGDLTDDQRRDIYGQIADCPVSQTLLKSISFREMQQDERRLRSLATHPGCQSCCEAPHFGVNGHD